MNGSFTDFPWGGGGGLLCDSLLYKSICPSADHKWPLTGHSLPPFLFSLGNISWNQSLPNQFTEHFLISYDRRTLFPICWTMIYSARPLGWALRLFPACPNPNSAVVNHCAAVFYNWAKNLGDTGWKGVCICDLSALITSPYWVHSNLYLSVRETWVKVQGSLRYMAMFRSWGL